MLTKLRGLIKLEQSTTIFSSLGPWCKGLRAPWGGALLGWMLSTHQMNELSLSSRACTSLKVGDRETGTQGTVPCEGCEIKCVCQIYSDLSMMGSGGLMGAAVCMPWKLNGINEHESDG